LLASDGDSIVGLWIEGQKYFGGVLKNEIIEAVQKDNLSVFAIARDWLDRYFVGEKPATSELPLAPIGSNFRKEVWNILRNIPYGECITYGNIARTIAAKTGQKTMSAQAVGGAVGHNPISIMIPCHRVVGANGSLTGYAGGIDKKIKLLEHEGIAPFSL
jgi:methylated-DNA-[protein]-cysteine S-methyltransferase